jgi:molybdate transport system substrate-binding protein
VLRITVTAAIAAVVLMPTVPGAQAIPPRIVRVAAAADLRFVLDELARRLERTTPAIRVQPSYGSSGTLHAQLLQRAPFDVYLSADVAYPRDLVRRGVGVEADLFTYARGRLVIWVPASSRMPIEGDGVRALARASRVAIANPEHAPYGRAAESALRAAGVWDALEGKLLLGENVGQAAQFVQSGGADAGMIAKSLAVAPAMRAAGRFVDVPPGSHAPLLQGGLILPWAVSRDAAAALRAALLGAEGRRLLAEYGFDLP